MPWLRLRVVRDRVVTMRLQAIDCFAPKSQALASCGRLRLHLKSAIDAEHNRVLARFQRVQNASL